MLSEYLTMLAGIISSLTIVGGALITIWKLVIVNPREKRRTEKEEQQQKDREEFERQLIDTVRQDYAPLSESIDRLNALLEESKRDRMTLHKITDVNVQQIGEHEELLGSHNERLIVLEVKTGVKNLRYKEVYKGEEE